jgi:predicted amidohydrolase
MKIRLIQKNTNDKNYLAHLQRTASDDVDLVCLGELSTSGCLYDGGPGLELPTLLNRLEDLPSAVMLGFPQGTEDGLYNSYLYYDKGEYQVYRKINLFPPMNEHKVYQPGSEPGLFETRFGKLGVAICYDIRFPELFKSLRDMGTDRIFVPAAFPRVRIDDWRRLLTQIAKENGVYIFGINAVGDDGINEFGGSSMVIDPGGKVLEQADETSERYIEVDV